MRTYPHDSPEAAARIVSLAMLADGHLGQNELDAVARLPPQARFGLEPADWREVMHAFCEDLLSSAPTAWADACRIDPRTLQQLLAEVQDPALRQRVLQACVAVAEADGWVSDGESIVLTAAIEQWGLHRQMFEPDAASAAVPS